MSQVIVFHAKMIGLFTSVVALKQILITSVVLKLGGVGPLGGLEPLQGGGGGGYSVGENTQWYKFVLI